MFPVLVAHICFMHASTAIGVPGGSLWVYVQQDAQGFVGGGGVVGLYGLAQGIL
jgi:hypothetical protein